MTILFIIPVFVFIMLLLLCRGGLRESAVKALIGMFVFIAVTTEVLSVCNLLNFSALLVLWLAFGIALLVVLLMRDNYSSGAGFSEFWRNTKFWDKIYLGIILLITGLTLITALLYPPNNFDSMTYHMTRVAAWAQNGNVEFFPTANIRQLFQMPLAEFGILHLQILTGSDLFANLVQWSSFVISIVLASLIAKELGCKMRGQMVSAVIAATLPMMLLQSSSTQNDLVVTVFCLAFAYYLLKLRGELRWDYGFFCSASCGLALLTKGSAYIFIASLGIVLGLAMIIHARKFSRKLERTGILILILAGALILNLGHYQRNYNLYGHPLSTEGQRYLNQRHTPVALVSNIVRNSALHWGVPATPVREYMKKGLKLILGNELNNPDTTWQGYEFDIPFTINEDTAGNLPQFWLIVFVLILLPFSRIENKKLVYWYIASIICGCLLFCLLLKWQIWGSRLHTTLFLLSIPVLGMLVSYYRKWFKYLDVVIIALLLIYSLPFLLLNTTRPLVPYRAESWCRMGRNDLYFGVHNGMRKDYRTAMDIIESAGPGQVGLVTGGNDWEYPIWMLCGKESGKQSPEFRHVNVNNISGILQKPFYCPEYIIVTAGGNSEAAKGYKAVYESKNITVFKR